MPPPPALALPSLIIRHACRCPKDSAWPLRPDRDLQHMRLVSNTSADRGPGPAHSSACLQENTHMHRCAQDLTGPEAQEKPFSIYEHTWNQAQRHSRLGEKSRSVKKCFQQKIIKYYPNCGRRGGWSQVQTIYFWSGLPLAYRCPCDPSSLTGYTWGHTDTSSHEDVNFIPPVLFSERNPSLENFSTAYNVLQGILPTTPIYL